MKTFLSINQTGTGAGSTFDIASTSQDEKPNRTFQATVSGTGSVAATVLVQVSNDPAYGWLTLGTITLSGTTTATDGFASEAAWQHVRSNVTAVSGTGAVVTVTMGS